MGDSEYLNITSMKKTDETRRPPYCPKCKSDLVRLKTTTETDDYHYETYNCIMCGRTSVIWWAKLVEPGQKGWGFIGYSKI